jgi:galactokinase
MSDADAMIDRLTARGLSLVEATRKVALFAETARVVAAQAGQAGADGTGALRQWFVPGRIEVLGKHTDYAGGRSLLCAVERGFCVSAAPRADGLLQVTDVRNGVSAQFTLSVDQPEETRWRNYPATVARRLARNFSGELRGAHIAFASDLPRSAGLSSSTTLIIAIFAALAEFNALEQHPAFIANIPTREALAAYLGCVENGRTFGTLIGDRGVGTRGGSQDHTAILCSEAGRLVTHAYTPARRERVVPMPAGYSFLIAASGVAAEKTGEARDDYNRAALAVSVLVEMWQRETGGDTARGYPAIHELALHDPALRDAAGHDLTLYDIVTGRDPTESDAALTGDSAGAPAMGGRATGRSGGAAGPDWFDAAVVAEFRELIARTPHPDFTREVLTARLDQFVLETFQIIPAAGDALARGDLAAFGDLVDRSQAAAELWLGNQVPETIALARLARTAGAAAASAFGAGFGGSVWALVETAGAAEFLDAWRSRYLANFPARADRAELFLTGAGPPLFAL